MIDTIDLPDDVMIQAAQDFFSSEWADAREESGFSFSPGTEITKVCPKQDHATLLGLIRPYVIRLAQAWGRGVGAMFSFMEIPEEEWADALFYVLMGCRGHGIGLEDDYGDNIDIAKDKLGSDIDVLPFYSEFSEFADLAYEVVETDARKPDPDPDSDALWLPGDRVRVDARMPTGDRLRGTGTILRNVSTSDLHHDDSGVIVMIDDDQDVEPRSYEGRTICVGEDDCEMAP